MATAEQMARYRAKKRRPKEITTEFLESELLKKYTAEDTAEEDKKDYLRFMIKIWESKHKVPQKSSEEQPLDLKKLMGNTPDAAASK
jgi:hypothetical protein